MIELLEQCMRIPSLSGQEHAVAEFLRDEMRRRGFDYTCIDEAGNAIGVIGDGRRQIMLLGHMDTVGGHVPVRYEDGKLYGRGAVDAKGPLCAFILAAEALAAEIATDWQIIVAGAVEEEAATSKGARFIAKQYHPEMCIIGEPSGADGITLGYKGRLLIHAHVERPSQHTAIPEPSVSELAVALWNHVKALADTWNADRPKAFDQLLPSLRKIQSGDDGLREWCDMLIGVRLPIEFGPEALQRAVEVWCAGRADAERFNLSFSGAEPAWRSERDTPLARAFVDAIRAEKMRPVFKLKTGTADFNVVGPIWKCPIVAYGPGDSSLDHTPHEHVTIDEFEKAVRVLTTALRSLIAAR
ncbi:MAG: [LysW]-lysine hydrolase [Anaerolineae bacterium]|nr:[LysW]-lysine hydrolase [Candidatus Roseilinea sp.]MDW8451261.1 [LysW]-lysine hydrolase [Anaerolineae bacterium]